MKGIDGTRNGWIVAEYTGKTWKLEMVEKLSNVEFESALIDIPIGLPENSTRKCDQEARSFLSPGRHYSVFNCPVREAVYAENYEEACDINEEKTGKRISKQAWNIVPKIHEADQVAQKKELEESHPEVFFKSIQPESVKNSKNTEKGIKDRIKVLEEYGDTSIINGFSNPNVSKDDLLDAMILSVSAEISLESIPEEPKRDSKGLKMQILRPV